MNQLYTKVVFLMLRQIFLKLLVQETIAAASTLQNLALLHGLQPRNKTQGKLSFPAKAEAKQTTLKYLIYAEEQKAADRCPKQDQIKDIHLDNMVKRTYYSFC